MEFKTIQGVEVEMCNGGWFGLVKKIKRINKITFSTDAQFFYMIFDWVKNGAITGKMFVYIMTHYKIIE